MHAKRQRLRHKQSGENRMQSKEITHIKDLKPDPRNARRHNPRNIGQIEHSLRQYGAARSIVISEDGEIIAGHGVVEAAAQAGIEKVRVVDASGHEIIAVRRKGLSEKDRKALAIADNRSSDLSDWNPDILKELSTEIDLGQFWNETELKDIFQPTNNEDSNLRQFSVNRVPTHLDGNVFGGWAACRWRREPSEDYEKFLEWKKTPTIHAIRTSDMARDIAELIEKWTGGWRGFIITVPPPRVSMGQEYPAGFLGKEVASRLGVDFVTVFDEPVEIANKRHWPILQLEEELGSGPPIKIRPSCPVILVDDMMTSGATARRCLAALRPETPTWFFCWITNAGR